MKIYTFRLAGKHILAAAVLLVILAALLILLLPGQGSDAENTSAPIRGQEDCIRFVRSLGFEVEPAAQSKRVLIPKEFDAVYQSYNQIQQDCGYDLLPYAGKKVDLTTFQVTNFPGTEPVLLDVLVHRRKVIGGAVYTAAVDGFMIGLQLMDRIPQ